MKKKVMLFLMAIMMSFSAMCYASYGSDLDAETKIVDQFFAGGDYKKASAFMDPSLAKDLTADRYKEMFANMNTFACIRYFPTAMFWFMRPNLKKGLSWNWMLRLKLPTENSLS